MQPGAGEPPVGEQLGGRNGRQLIGRGVDETDRVVHRGLHHVGERVLVGDRHQGAAVGPQQVPDLVGDRPARGGRRRGPALIGERRDQRVELVAFGAQVVDNL